MREVRTVGQALAAFYLYLKYLTSTLMPSSDPGCLFSRTERTPEEVLAELPGINNVCFYGNYLGIQFCESIRAILKGLSILMISLSEVHYSDGNILERATNILWHSSKYATNPEMRARRIVQIFQYSSIDFCKKFWSLGENELFSSLSYFVNPSVEVNRMISIPPEPLTYPRTDGIPVDIPVPAAHKGPASLQVRLVSAVKRQHMMGEAGAKDSGVPPSKGLIFHCHGGGFVAQTSRSHETYLRQWAQGLPVPILSVDYSLAPEAPFPRALEEAFYAYCWALNNLTLLGTTGERIVFAGDSAGANLVIGVTMKCIELGLRPPDSLFLAYVPVVLSFIPSPSKFLYLMDPILPLGFLMSCRTAYISPPNVNAKVNMHEDKLRRKKGSKEIRTTEAEVSNPKNRFDERLPPKEEESGKSALLSLPTYVSLTGLPTRLTRAAGNIVTGITGTISSITPFRCTNTHRPIRKDINPLMETMMLTSNKDTKFEVPHDPYLSPYWANDTVLEQFPTTHVMALQMDPCLDDCVEFAKRLKKLGVSASIDIIDGLPHGFLNLVNLNKEACEASKRCIQKLNGLLKLDSI